MAKEIVLAGACRTAIGKFGGSLANIPAVELGALVIKEAVRRAGIKPEDVDEVLMGNVLQAGLGQSPARQAAIKAGLPESVPALTVNNVCGSGLKCVNLAADMIAMRRCGRYGSRRYGEHEPCALCSAQCPLRLQDERRQGC